MNSQGTHSSTITVIYSFFLKLYNTIVLKCKIQTSFFSSFLSWRISTKRQYSDFLSAWYLCCQALLSTLIQGYCSSYYFIHHLKVYIVSKAHQQFFHPTECCLQYMSGYLEPHAWLWCFTSVNFIRNTLSVPPLGQVTCDISFSYKVISPSMLVPKDPGYSSACFNCIIFFFFNIGLRLVAVLHEGVPVQQV